MDLQWFGRPGPRRMPDRHDKNMAPLYKNGRLFVSGDDYVVAVDAYNGTILWERDVPRSVRLGAFKNCGSMAATDDRLYVASGSDCLALDAGSGRLGRTLHIPAAPDGTAREWGYVAVTTICSWAVRCAPARPFASRPSTPKCSSGAISCRWSAANRSSRTIATRAGGSGSTPRSGA